MSDKKTQYEKFRQAARELEADESTERFERTLEKLAKPVKSDSENQDKKKPAD